MNVIGNDSGIFVQNRRIYNDVTDKYYKRYKTLIFRRHQHFDLF